MSKIDELLKNEKVEWKKIGDIKEIKVISPNRKIKKQEYLVEGIYPVIDQGQSYIVGYTNDSSAVFDKNSYVVFGDHTESVKYVDFQFAQGADGIKVLQTDEKYLNSKYLFYVILNFYKTTGKYMRHFSLLKETEIPIPSLETQEKIVKILDKFTNDVTELQAELQAELQKRTKQYEYYRDMLLSEEYLNKISEQIDGLGDNIYSIRFTTLREVAKVNRGASPRPISKYLTDDDNGIPWIKIGDIGVNSKYVTNTAQKITLEGAKKSRILSEGDFIISNSMSYGRPYILNIKGAIHDGWAAISDFDEYLNSDFLYHFLNSSAVQNYWRVKINSSSVSNLNSEIIKSLPIPIIDKNLQNKIVEILDKFQELLSDTKGLLPHEIKQRQKQYEYYREKLLTFEKDGENITC